MIKTTRQSRHLLTSGSNSLIRKTRRDKRPLRTRIKTAGGVTSPIRRDDGYVLDPDLGIPSNVLTWRGIPLTWRGEYLTWR